MSDAANYPTADRRPSAQSGGSRPSKTKAADTENPKHRRQRRRVARTSLTERENVTLRREVKRYDSEPGERATSWGGAVREWREYIEESLETSVVLENQATGETYEGSDPNRFAPEYADKQYAKLKDLERGLKAEYGKRLHTAMLTFTASSTGGGTEPLPPVDHLDGLLSSWEAVTRSLRRVMDGRRYERLAILEPHKSGYLHVHMAVFVDGPVSAETFAPVIEAHLRNCDLAGEEAHDLDDDSTVSVKHVGSDRETDGIENLGTYLAEYLGTYGDDPLDAPEHQQMANAVLWATQKRRWRPSQGAQEYMATNYGEPSPEWELVGVRRGDGEVMPATPGGGVQTFTTRERDPDDDPPD